MDYKYKMTSHCKFCGKKYEYHSNWFPCEVMMGWLNIILLFHVAIHHPTELTSRRIWYQLKEIIKGLFVIIIYGFLGILQIVFFPIYWVLDNFLY